jgi:hypothetical protein
LFVFGEQKVSRGGEDGDVYQDIEVSLRSFEKAIHVTYLNSRRRALFVLDAK